MVNYLVLILLLILLPACVGAKDLYRIRELSEPELVATYERMMLDACRYSDRDWHEWAEDPKAGHWGTGMSGGNEGIRAISQMVLASGALLRYSNALRGDDRREFLRKTTAAIRYTVATHCTGTRRCTDGKQWGGDWQSAMWTGTLAFGAWLVWDDLDADLRKKVKRVVTSEADRFLAGHPPTGRWSDTKAEENGWSIICISAAANMFPSHPRAAAWNEKAIEYMMNTLCVPRDMKDDTLVDGRPVREWVRGANLHPDFTLENHNMFHPSYVQCSSYFLTEASMHYVYADRPVPRAASHHLMDTWHMFQTILLPWGETAFPQGMDWELHGLPAVNLFASIACLTGDPVAAEMESKILQYMRTWQEWLGGDLAVPGSSLGFTRHSIQAEQTTYGYLAHRLLRREGGSSAARSTLTPTLSLVGRGGTYGSSISHQPSAISHSATVRSLSSIGVLLHRTKSKFVSFSWKYHIMGMVIPIGEGHLGNPQFMVPIRNGLVGTTELAHSQDARVRVLDHRWKKTPNGFETAGTLITNGERLRQAIKVTSAGEKTVVYQDRITAESEVFPARELGVPVGIENDQLTGGTRTVYHRDGKTVFDWKQPAKPFAIPGNWANVDGRLGVVAVESSGLAYVQGTGYNAQGVCVDTLYGSFSDRPRGLKAGDLVARRIVLLFTEVTPEETAAIARSVRAEDTPEGKVIRFGLPGEGEVETDVSRLDIR